MIKLEIVKDFSVKTVDMTSKNWPEMLAYSLSNTGFAVLKNHGIDLRDVQVLYEQWEVFFKSADKMLYKTGDNNSGYIPYRTEHAKNNEIKDLKEFFHIFYPFKSVPIGVSQYLTQKVATEMLKIARHLLFVLQGHVPTGRSIIQKEPLHKMIKNSPNNLLRILHYPSVPAETEKGAVRAAEHEDINLITLLPAATQPGLEVKDLNGNWHKIECDPETIIVNVGDMLQEASDGFFKSTTHRVINPAGENVSRYSMPFFVHPRPECVLSKNYTAGQYLNERLGEIGLK